jgi:hypothetical protein
MSAPKRLVGCCCLLIIVAGCVGGTPESTVVSTDTAATTTEPTNGTVTTANGTDHCVYVHTLRTDDIRYTESTYEFRNLSEDAKTIVNRTVKGGTYTVSEPTELPAEFSYGDEATKYQIVTDNGEYVIDTVTAAPCTGGR